MSPPNAITTTNAEDGIRALRPVAIIPNIENEESGDESSVNENMEQDVPPEEEAPLNNDNAEEVEEASDSSVAPPITHPTSLASPPMNYYNPYPAPPMMYPMHPNTFHVGESSRGVVRPRPDEPLMTFTGIRRISEPYRMTVPIDETPILYSLSGDPYRPPTTPAVPPHNPDYNLQMYHEIQTLREQQREMFNRQEYLERLAASDFDRFSYRMDTFEVELMRLRGMIVEMSAQIHRLEHANFRGRNQ